MGTFERAWNEVYGLDQDPIREHVIFPALFRLNKDFKGKSVLDVGCGNGCLAHKLAGKRLKELVGVDRSAEFLAFAEKNVGAENVCFRRLDIRKRFPFKGGRFDLVYCLFVLNEVDHIRKTVSEMFRVLKRGGKCYLVVLHPVYALSLYLHEKHTGKRSRKLSEVRGYFTPFKADYLLSIAGKAAPYHHRTVADYVGAVLDAGFRLTGFLELTANAPAVKRFPRYKDLQDVPKFLILEATKP